MTQFAHERLQGSLWTRGIFGVVAGSVVIIGLLIWVPPIRWFLGIAVVIGIVMAGVIRWYNEHTPVKVKEEEVMLHLNDDEPLPPLNSESDRKVG